MSSAHNEWRTTIIELAASSAHNVNSSHDPLYKIQCLLATAHFSLITGMAEHEAAPNPCSHAYR